MFSKFFRTFLKTITKQNEIIRPKLLIFMIASIAFMSIILTQSQAAEDLYPKHTRVQVKTISPTRVTPADLPPDIFKQYIEDPLSRTDPEAWRQKYMTEAARYHEEAGIRQVKNVKRHDKYVKIFGSICDVIAVGCQSALLKHCQLETVVDPTTHQTHTSLSAGCEWLGSISLAASVLKLGSVYWESKYEGCCLPNCASVCRMSWINRGKAFVSITGFLCNTVTLATLGKVDPVGLVTGSLLSYGSSILATTYQFCASSS